MSRESAASDRMSSTAGRAVVIEAAARELARQLDHPLRPGLHLVATPIGNLADTTLRAIATLAQADAVYCEDTRHSRALMQHFALSPRLRPYHEHNAEAERPKVLAALAEGQRIALISDAGTPLVSDPGFKLAREAIAAGHPVWSLPGPSAVLAALTSSGLPTDSFLFAGFLPPRQAARRTRITELAGVPATLVLFEAPSRVAESLGDLSAVLGPRPAVIARELTKLHEAVLRGPLPELADRAGETHWRGEIVLVVAPGIPDAWTDEDIASRLATVMTDHSLRDGARLVADALGVSRGRVYNIGLGLLKERST